MRPSRKSRSAPDAGSKQRARWTERTKSNSLISVRAGVSAGQSKRTRTPPEAAKWAQQQACGSNVSARMSGKQVNSRRASRASARNQGQEREAVVRAARRGAPCKVLGVRRRRGYRDCSCRGARRQAEWPACRYSLSLMSHALMPNPSVNLTPCGSPRLAFISFWAKHGLPQGAGYLER